MLWKLCILYYGALSVVSALMLAVDKRQALRGRRRVREKTLHSIELLGGWPGAILATRTLDHKRRKPKYMRVLYAYALLHVLGWFALMWIATR